MARFFTKNGKKSWWWLASLVGVVTAVNHYPVKATASSPLEIDFQSLPQFWKPESSEPTINVAKKYMLVFNISPFQDFNVSHFNICVSLQCFSNLQWDFFPKKSAIPIFPLAERWLVNSCPLGSPLKSQEASESAEGARVVWETQSVRKILQRKSRAKAEGFFEKLWWFYVGVFFSMDFHGISLVLCYRKLFFNLLNGNIPWVKWAESGWYGVC